MPTIIDALVVTLGLDPRSFTKGSRDARQEQAKTKDDLVRSNKEIEAHAKRVAETYSQIAGEIKGLVLTVAGATGVTDLFKSIVGNAADVGRLATNLGVATDELSAWQQAIKEVGGTADEASQSLQALVTARENLLLRGSTGHDADFAGLSISAADLRDPSALLMKLAARGQTMAPAEFTNRLTALGLPQSMITLLERGPDALSKTIANYRQNGVTDRDAQAAMDFQKALAALTNKLRDDLLPVATRVANLLTEMADGIDRIMNDPWFSFHRKGGAGSSTPAGREAAQQGSAAGQAALHALDLLGVHVHRRAGAPPPAVDLAQTKGAQAIADRIIAVEGTGKNPLSSAQGVGQFTNRSWLDLYKQQFGSQGKTDAQILALRNNPQIAHQMVQLAVANYTRQLSSAGLPITAGNIYLMHFLGPRRAIQALKANPKTAMAAIAPEDINANPFLANMTAGDLIGRTQAVMSGARRSLGGGGGSAGSTSTNSVENNVGVINVYTPATDGEGIARSLPQALKKRGLLTQANTGLQQ